MNRGVISLTTNQQLILLQLCKQFPATATPELITRLEAAAQQTHEATGTTSVTLQLTEDSAEAALDILPIPTDNEPETITALRTDFQTFLTQLRRTNF